MNHPCPPTSRPVRGVTACLGALTALAIALMLSIVAAPAQARVTPAGVAVSGSSTDSVITDAAGNSTSCQRVDGSGRVSVDGMSASLRLTRFDNCRARHPLGPFLL